MKQKNNINVMFLGVILFILSICVCFPFYRVRAQEIFYTDQYYIDLKIEEKEEKYILDIESKNMGALDWVGFISRLNSDVFESDLDFAIKSKNNKTVYPTEGDLLGIVYGEAKSIFRYFDVLGTAIDWAVNKVFGNKIEDKVSIPLNKENVYLIRAYSGGYGDTEEKAFVKEKVYKGNERDKQAMTLNLGAALLDTLGVFIPFTELVSDGLDEIVAAGFIEISHLLFEPDIMHGTPDSKDLLQICLKSGKTMLTKTAEVIKKQATQNFFKFITKNSKQLLGIVNLSEKISKGGRIFDRITQMLLVATPLETSYLVIGDPLLALNQVEEKSVPAGLWEFAEQVEQALSGQDVEFIVDNTLFEEINCNSFYETPTECQDSVNRDILGMKTSDGFVADYYSVSQWRELMQNLLSWEKTEYTDNLGSGNLRLHGIDLHYRSGITLVLTYIDLHGEQYYRGVIHFFVSEQEGKKWKIHGIQQGEVAVVVYESCISELNRECKDMGEFLEKILIASPNYIKWPGFSKMRQDDIEQNSSNITGEDKNINQPIVDKESPQKQKESEDIKEDPAELPVLSWPSAKIVYVSKESDRFGDIGLFTINVDGTDKINLETQLKCAHSSPKSSPDGSKIIFMQFERCNMAGASDNSEIYIINSNGSNLRKLTDNKVEDYYPSWFPDGSKIIFSRQISDSPFSMQLFTMNVDGDNQQQLSIDKEFIDSLKEVNLHHPVVAPNKQKIAFVASTDIYVMDIDGTDIFKISESSSAPSGLTWMPDSESLLYSKKGGVYIKDIYRKENEKLLFPDRYDASVSKDGKWVVFNSGGIFLNCNIYIASIAEGTAKYITKGVKPVFIP